MCRTRSAVDLNHFVSIALMITEMMIPADGCQQLHKNNP